MKYFSHSYMNVHVKHWRKEKKKIQLKMCVKTLMTPFHATNTFFTHENNQPPKPNKQTLGIKGNVNKCLLFCCVFSFLHLNGKRFTHPFNGIERKKTILKYYRDAV